MDYLKKNLLTAAVLLTTLVGCDNTPSNNQMQSDVVAAEKSIPSLQTQEQAYLQLVEDYFADFLALEPIYATYVGINIHNDKFGEHLSNEYLTKRHNLNSDYLKKLTKIDRSKLPQNLQLSYDIFKYDRETELTNEAFPDRFLPINQFYSAILTLFQLSGGESAQPFNTVQDYENWLSRVDGFADWTKRVMLRMNEGIENKVVLPMVLVEKMVPQLDAQIGVTTTESIFYQPITHFPETFPDNEKRQLTVKYQQMIENTLTPALTELRQYLAEVYLPQSRGTDGMWALPNGRVWYQTLANQHTTTTISVDDIHEIGLDEVKRIREEMNKVKSKVGFEGDLNSFFNALSSNPQYIYTNKQDLIDGFLNLKMTINEKLDDYFNVKPKADYMVKAVEAYREKSAAGASYQMPAVDGSRPGTFYINTYNLQAQPKWGMTTLSLHEAAPGHHFQIAIKQELDNIPDFQRFSVYNAFEEGWALYSEYLGNEMGLFEDPYQYFGHLSDEMLRAIRLVVDTGIHAKGWSREHAIEYMKRNSPMTKSDIISEIERYMAIPGQALSYKIGQLKILELRAKAENAFGDKFDIKAFHDQILTSGSLPLSVMEKKINHWILTSTSNVIK